MTNHNTILDCFLVAPFGDKGHQMHGGMPHFELVRSAIKEIVESFPDARIRLRRADEIADVPSVPETFIRALQKADIVVAELSATGNANVYYELGIRFAIRRAITIPIWQIGTKIPADLQGLLGIEYEPTNPLAQRETFYKFLRSRLAGDFTDSPVYQVLPDLHITTATEVLKLTERVTELEALLRETMLSQAVRQTWDEAEALAAKANLTAALDTMKLAYDSAPRNLQLLVRYGQLLSRASRHDEAIAILNAAVGVAKATGGPVFIPYRELGMAYKRGGRQQLAADSLLKAVAENPRDADSHGIIGGIHKDAYDIDKAIESYQRGFDLDERSTYCLLNVVCLLALRGNIGDKLRLKKLLPLSNQLTSDALLAPGADHWNLYDRGHVLLLSGKPSEASHMFAEAIAATRTIEELRSARKNLDLLLESDTSVTGLTEVLGQFAAAEIALASIQGSSA